MSNSHGHFVWYELLTTNAEAARAFYRGVMGWQMQDSGMTDRSYTILSVGDVPMAGLMPLPLQALADGARPAWAGYIAVDDVDLYVTRVEQAGGSIHRAAEDIPGVGRFALVGDPQGAVFVLFKGMGDAPTPPALGTPGHVGWNELSAGEWRGAFAFYAELFNWTAGDTVDMGDMGLYQLFAVDGIPVGGMMTKPESLPHPMWLYYFNVDDIDSAAKRVTQEAGQVLQGPHQVPGGSWIVVCLDPQGAMFALVGPKPHLLV